MCTSSQTTDYILSKIDTQAGETISPLKLQKLLYYCQAWHLTIFNKCLFKEKIEAWAHGPVVPSQYARFAGIFREDAIKINNINLVLPNLKKETKELLDEVLSIYGEHSAGYLETLTHKEIPWCNARGNLKPYEKSTNEITHKSMIDYYSAFKKNGK